MAEQLRVFVSHSHQDNAFCQQIVQALRDAGADVWYDVEDRSNDILRRQIMRELSARPVFLVVLSEAAFASSWVQDECEWAYNLYRRKPGRLFLPVTGAPYDPGDFDSLLYVESLPRIEAPSCTPYPVAEAANRLVRALGLTPRGEETIPVAPHADESADDLLTRGKALLTQEKFTEALPFFERATELAPTTFDAWFGLGYAHGKLGHWHEALAPVDRALALDPNSALAWSGRGQLLGGWGRYTESLVAYNRALELDPNDPFSWGGKGAALAGQGKHNEALAAFDRALALDPTIALIWGAQGLSFFALDRFEEALRAFNRMIAINPTVWSVWLYKANTLRALGRTAEAEEAARLAKGLRGKE